MRCSQNGGQGPITLGVMFLHRFQILPFLKIFVTDFSETMKCRKLKVCINMDNDWMYCVYQNRGQGFITLGVISLCRFSVTNFCGPTSVLIPHLVSKVRKVLWQNGGQESITLGVISLHRFFQILPFLKIFVTDF